MPAHELRSALAAALLLAAPAAHAEPATRPAAGRIDAASPARPAAHGCGGVADLTAEVEARHAHGSACEGQLRAALTNRASASAFCGVAPVRSGGAIERAAWVTVPPGETLDGLSWCGFPEGSVQVVCVAESERDWCVMERFAALRAAAQGPGAAEVVVHLGR